MLFNPEQNDCLKCSPDSMILCILNIDKE